MVKRLKMLAKKPTNPLEKFKGYKRLIECKRYNKKIFTEYKNHYFCDECSNKVKDGRNIF